MLHSLRFVLPSQTLCVKELSMTRLMKTLLLTVVCGSLVLKAVLPATAQTLSELQE